MDARLMPPLEPGPLVVGIGAGARRVESECRCSPAAELADDLIVLRRSEPLAERQDALIFASGSFGAQLLDLRLGLRDLHRLLDRLLLLHLRLRHLYRRRRRLLRSSISRRDTLRDLLAVDRSAAAA